MCGTGAAVRNMGFMAPAAGKTGTSHDAWFAGYTSNLLCIVWVGNDDYTDIKIEGAHAAAPIWAAFMKQAVQLPQYSDTQDFTPPDGVQVVSIDKVTNLLSDAACPDAYDAAFLDGTAPTDTCDHPPDHRNIFQKIFGLGGKTEQVGSAQPSTSLPSGMGWQCWHQNVTRASAPWMRRRIALTAAPARLATAAIDPEALARVGPCVVRRCGRDR